MHQSLVVVAFLLFRCHPAAIQEQPPPVALTANHADPLERTSLLDQHLSLQSIADAAVFFVNPAAHGLWWAPLQLRTRGGLLPNTISSAFGIDEHNMWRVNVFGWGAAVEEGSSKAFVVRSRLL